MTLRNVATFDPNLQKKVSLLPSPNDHFLPSLVSFTLLRRRLTIYLSVNRVKRSSDPTAVRRRRKAKLTRNSKRELDRKLLPRRNKVDLLHDLHL